LPSAGVFLDTDSARRHFIAQYHHSAFLDLLAPRKARLIGQ
jgi:hypothetical protein